MATFISAVRCPALLWGAALWVTCSETLLPNVMIYLNHHSPDMSAMSVLSVRPDYWLYLPNVVVCLAYLLGMVVLLELKHAVRPDSASRSEDALTAAIGLMIACSMLIWVRNTKPGVLQLLLSGLHAGILWLFFVCNAGLYTVRRWVTDRPWGVRFLTWTFPVSDLLCYLPHRLRLQAHGAGWWRLLPVISYVLMVGVALVAQTRIFAGAVRAERINVPVETALWAQYAGEGFWFTNDSWWDPLAGIWYYDERTKTGRPFVRVSNTRLFHFIGDDLYFWDRYDNHVVKMDAKTRRVIWKVPTKPGLGTYEILMGDNLVFAEGEGGYMIVITTDGKVLAERDFRPIKTWSTVQIRGGDIAFVSGDQRLRIWRVDLSAGEELLLPTPKGVIEIPHELGHGGIGAVTNMSDYDRTTGIMYLGTFWGDVARFDSERREWLPSFRTSFALRTVAIDRRNRLLFALNYFQGYLHVMDLDSGEHVGYILANGLGRFINLDPARRKGTLSTHGYGVYEFDYTELAQRLASRDMLASRPE